MTPTVFNHWLLRAKPREILVYHTGFLPVDRAYNRELNKLAKRIWASGEAGFVELTQARCAPGICAYMAIRTEEIAG